MIVLVANIGSTSFKYRAFEMPGEVVLAEGKFERIGQAGSKFPNYESAIHAAISELCGEGRCLRRLSDLSAVGFKAVHAGPLSGARLVDDEVLAAMEDFSFFAPAHNPPYIAAMRAFRHEAPEVPLVALFETAFFHALRESAVTYAVPKSWRENFGIRRYGFHGASHRAASEYVCRQFARTDLRHISCHLGGSSSIAAVCGGDAVDVSFGISPQSGLPQNNRVGDIDPFAVLFMMKKLGAGVDEMAAILSTECGLVGISGCGGDIRDIENAAASGDADARLALDVYVRAIRHYIGAFFAELGGLDVLTFSGGIGENSASIRGEVCRGLGALGIDIEEDWNRVIGRRGTISSQKSAVKVLVLPADEELIVARATAEVAKAQVMKSVAGGSL